MFQMNGSEIVTKGICFKIISVTIYFLLSGFILSFNIANADTVFYKDGYLDPFTNSLYQGTKDTTIEAIAISWVGNNANQNFGGRESLAVGRNVQFGFYGPQRTLISFDISSIANRYAQINSITFRLFPSLVFFPGSITSNVLSVYELTEANEGWVEGTEFESDLGEAPDIGMVTWNNKIEGAESWAGSIGASSPGIDYLDIVLAGSLFDNTTPVDVPYDLLISGQAAHDLVELWLTSSNSGVILVANEDTYHSHSTIIRFWSSESTNINYRPELIIDFVPALEPIRIAGSVPVYYSSLQAAYDDSNDGDIIEIRSVILSEDLYVHLNKSITITGGYDSAYSGVNGVTILNGNIEISNGTLIIGHFNLES